MNSINSSGVCSICGLTVDDAEVRMPLVGVRDLPHEFVGARLHFKCAVTSRHAEAIGRAFCIAGGSEGTKPNGGWGKAFDHLGFASSSRFELQVFSPQLLLVLPVPNSELEAVRDALAQGMTTINVRGLMLDFSRAGTVEVRSCPHNWMVAEAPAELIQRNFRSGVEGTRLNEFVELVHCALAASQAHPTSKQKHT
jgi:hypothetical protein